MAPSNYVGPPVNQLAHEFIKGWQVFRQQFDSSLKLPSLDDETEKKFLELKTQLVQKSRVIEVVSDGDWGLHGKVKGLANNIQSLDFYRQENIIFHDNMNNQWHDIYIQMQKTAAAFDQRVKEEAEEA